MAIVGILNSFSICFGEGNNGHSQRCQSLTPPQKKKKELKSSLSCTTVYMIELWKAATLANPQPKST